MDTLRSYRGLVEAAVASSVAIATALSQFKSQWDKQPWVTALGVLVVVIAGTLFLRRMLRARQVHSVSTTCFVGPQPLDSSDLEKRGFFGRDSDIEKIVKKLSSPANRHLVLIGESGCGKTSLLNAGVIPRLTKDGVFHCVYVCLKDQPVKKLQEALRAVAVPPAQNSSEQRALEAGTNATSGAESVSLVEELRQAGTRSGKPIILFIDQFEEFHVNPITPEDYRAVQELVWAIVGRDSTGADKLVFSLRYDFLHMLDVFYDEAHVDQTFGSSEVKVRIEPFPRMVAEEVLRKTLTDKTGELMWDENLLRRVLDDLTTQRYVHGQQSQIVLPAELQIVCQMVQTKGISSAALYPGKKRLLLEHVSDAIDTVPGSDPTQVKQVLLNLINADGVTKARPQSIEDLAAVLRLRERDYPRLRRMLTYLDTERRIVRSFKPDQAREQTKVVFELAHDYLVGLIRVIAGEVMSGVRRSQAILATARMQAEYNSGYRLSIADCWHLRRYPAERMSSEDRELVRRSVRAFMLRTCVPFVALMCGWAMLRFGFMTLSLSVQSEEVVLRRGLPWVQPVLGSSDTAVATMVRERGLGQHESGKLLFAQLKESRIQPQALQFLNPMWSGDVWLRKQLEVVVAAYFEAQRSKILVHEYSDLEAVKFVRALNMNAVSIAEGQEKRLAEAFALHGRNCVQDRLESTDCENGLALVRSVAESLRQIRQDNAKLIEQYRQVPRNTEPETWAFRAAVQILRELKPSEPLDAPLLQHVISHTGSSDSIRVAAVIRWLKPLETSEKNLSAIIGTTARQQAIATLWAAVNAQLQDEKSQAPDATLAVPQGTPGSGVTAPPPTTKPEAPLPSGVARPQRPLDRERLQKRHIDALVALGLPNNALQNLLQEQANGPDVEKAERALIWLIQLKVPADEILRWLVPIFDAAEKQLDVVLNLDLEYNRILTSDKYPRDLRLALRLTDILYRQTLWNDPQKTRVFHESLASYTRKSLSRTASFSGVRTNRLFGLARSAGIPASDILDMLPEAGAMKFEDYRSALYSIHELPYSGSKRPLQLRIFADQSSRKILSNWVERMVGKGGYDSCEWAKTALNYNITTPDIEKRADDPRCVGFLDEAYARTVHLRTAKSCLDPTHSLYEGPEEDPARVRSWTEVQEHLFRELYGHRAQSRSTYRSTVTKALALLISEQKQHAPSAVVSLKQDLVQRLADAATPIQLRLAFVTLIDEIDRATK